ncbi:MAG TPA: shikimate dehydrogenase [Solirubrobacteraceae bacterium]|nr:shikimate dehydrogenase [Solirubrobacteraceae bacterium]
MTRLGVLGWPVAHSRSPALQNAALEAAGLGARWCYQRLPVPPELFAETVRALPAAGFRGVNVTIPHKEAALALASGASPRAAAIGAANVLLFGPDGGIWADNTDAPALVEALSRRTDIAGASVLVLGAGGSARAAVWALRDAGAGEVAIWNRSAARAAALAAEFGARAVAEPFAAADILVNCTSVGLRPDDELEALLPSSHQLQRHRAVADLVYREGGTPLVRAARASGVPTIDGLELLVGQGAAAFELFTGLSAPVAAMRRALGLSSGE